MQGGQAHHKRNTLTLRITFMKSSSKFLLNDLGEYLIFSLTNKYVEEE